MEELLADILNTCLLRLDSGASVDECLAAFPQQRALLEAPLRAAARMRTLPHPPLPATTRATLETRMLALANQRRAAPAAPAAPPPSPVPGPAALLAGLLRALGYRGPMSQPWLGVGALALALLLALILGAGTLAAARAVIRTMQGPTAVPTSAPLTTMPFTLNGPIKQMIGERWVINDISVTVDAQAAITGTPAVGAAAQIRGIIQDNGTLLAQTIMITSAPPTPSTLPSATASPPPTSSPTATPAPTSTPPPVPTATPPPAGTIVNITGVVQQITIINNVSVIVVNDISYMLPPNLVLIVGERLRIGAPIVFVGEWNAVGQIIIITIVEIDHKPIVINPPPPSNNNNNDDDDDDDDDDD